MRYFREKLNRRNVTADVKHYEHCEQLFASVGKCYVVEAFLDFFHMADAKHKPKANAPPSAQGLTDADRKSYIINTLDKFIDKYILFDGKKESAAVQTDGIWCYSVNLLKSFMLLADIKDAVATGNGQHLSNLRKQLLVHFFVTGGFNEFAIEMLVNILQTQVLLSEAEAYNCQWAVTVNWKGGVGHNIEIDLFQENMNSDMKKLIRSMGANKTEKAITRASKASAGVTNIVESFEKQVSIHRRSSTHMHKSSSDDERLILSDLRAIRPFEQEEGRMFESFVDIPCDPTHLLDEAKFKQWIARHKNNILMHYPSSSDCEPDENVD